MLWFIFHFFLKYWVICKFAYRVVLYIVEFFEVIVVCYWWDDQSWGHIQGVDFPDSFPDVDNFVWTVDERRVQAIWATIRTLGETEVMFLKTDSVE